MNYFCKESRSKKNYFLGVGEEGNGGLEEVIFFNKESKTYLKTKKKIFWGVGGGGGRRREGGGARVSELSLQTIQI